MEKSSRQIDIVQRRKKALHCVFIKSSKTKKNISNINVKQIFCNSLMLPRQLTSSDDSLYANVGSIYLFGKVSDSLVWVFIGVRMDVRSAAWKLHYINRKGERKT